MSLFTANEKEGAGPDSFISFRAGKINVDGKQATPDERRGLLYLQQGAEPDRLMQLCWKDRETGEMESPFPLLVFPFDFTIQGVPESKAIETKRGERPTADGRVFSLKWGEANRILYFWMQEPDPHNDDTLWKRMQDILNDPPAAPQGDDDSGVSSEMLEELARRTGIPADQLQQIIAARNGADASGGLGGALSGAGTSKGGQTTAPKGASAAPSKAKIEQQQNLLSSFFANTGAAGTTPSPETGASTSSQPKPSYSDLAKQSTVSEILSADSKIVCDFCKRPEVQEKLFPLLPEEHRTESQLINLLSTPQFRGAISKIDAILFSPSAAEFLASASFPIPKVGFGPEYVIKALIEKFKEQTEEEEEEDQSGSSQGEASQGDGDSSAPTKKPSSDDTDTNPDPSSPASE